MGSGLRHRHRESLAGAADRGRVDDDVGRCRSIRGDVDAPPRGVFGDEPGGDVVRARDEPRRRSRELPERGLDRGDAPVVIEVVGLDVRDDRDVRAVREKRAVRLVRLDDRNIARSGVCPADRARNAEDRRADREARIDPARLKRVRDHRRRGRLAVSPRDRDDAFALDGPHERLGSVPHGDSRLPRRDELGVRVAHGRRDDDGRGAVDDRWRRGRRARRGPRRGGPQGRAHPPRRSPRRVTPGAASNHATADIPAPPTPMK